MPWQFFYVIQLALKMQLKANNGNGNDYRFSAYLDGIKIVNGNEKYFQNQRTEP